MGTLIWLGLRAFVFSLILTPIIRDIFRVFELVDRPDSTRKTHPHPIPRVGGIAVIISYLLASYFTPALRADSSLSLVARLLPAILIIFATGFIDDFVDLKPWQKLVAETVAAALAYWAGARVATVAGQPTLGWWSLLITIIWLVACTNAFNLVDGLDGLAAGIGLVATLTIFVGALAEGSTALCIATLPLAGCLLAFLCFNFNPATIFLGDCGSLLVGFLLGCYGVIWSQKSLTIFGMVAPLIAFSVPLLDVGLSIFRRILRGQPILSADRSHIHHRLIDRGLSQRRVVLIIYGICGFAAALALLQRLTNSYYLTLLVVLALAFVIWIGIGYLRYSEFTFISRLFRTRTIQRLFDTQLVIEKFAMALFPAKTVEECWEVIRRYYPNLGFAAVRLQANGVLYRDWPSHVIEPDYWTVRIPFGDEDFVELAHPFGSEDLHSIVAPVANMLHQTLAKHLLEKPRETDVRAAASS
jgi:UDP-GlcNAc:undecaprenyl-phosphate GlcNAc-1-phosphate transferase